MKKQREVICHQCGECFWAQNKAKYCSDACRSKASRERSKVYFDAVCKGCQTAILTSDSRVKYCSASCRLAAQALRY